MKVLFINGSPNEFGCTYTALAEAQKVFEAAGIETEIVYLGKKPVAGCIACGLCRKTGLCAFDDQVNEIIDDLDEIDGIIVGSPVYYAGVSGQITSFLDRLFYAAGGKMKGKPAATVVSCRRGGASAAFEIINKYFMMNNMPVVTSQYWNMCFGSNGEQAEQDGEGMQTMRTLGENMAWMIKCIDAGKKAGIPLPKIEDKIKTNFIK